MSILLTLLLFTTSAHGAMEKDQTCGNYLQTSLALLDVHLEEAIRGTGLRAIDLARIREHSAGITDVYSFLKEQEVKEGYLLGLSAPYEFYESYIRATGLIRWQDAYKKFGIEFGERNHTQKFMETLVKQGRPIVFLVPRDLWLHPQGVATKREMWWLLENPEEMKKVTFVFGSLEVIDSKNWDEVFSPANMGRPGPGETLSFWEIQVRKLAVALKHHAIKYRP